MEKNRWNCFVTLDDSIETCLEWNKRSREVMRFKKKLGEVEITLGIKQEVESWKSRNIKIFSSFYSVCKIN